MRTFARLFATLDETMRTNEKVSAMADYFATAAPADAAWAVYFLSGTAEATDSRSPAVAMGHG